jgi:hypothetical protein
MGWNAGRNHSYTGPWRAWLIADMLTGLPLRVGHWLNTCADEVTSGLLVTSGASYWRRGYDPIAQASPARVVRVMVIAGDDPADEHAGQGGDREGGERAILLLATPASVEAARI